MPDDEQHDLIEVFKRQGLGMRVALWTLLGLQILPLCIGLYWLLWELWRWGSELVAANR